MKSKKNEVPGFDEIIFVKRKPFSSDHNYSDVYNGTSADRFVAENGRRQTYEIDYIRSYSESRGSAIWEGRFLVDDVGTQNYWYADPGEVEFGDGGYAFGGPPWRSVCDELGYTTNEV